MHQFSNTETKCRANEENFILNDIVQLGICQWYRKCFLTQADTSWNRSSCWGSPFIRKFPDVFSTHCALADSELCISPGFVSRRITDSASPELPPQDNRVIHPSSSSIWISAAFQTVTYRAAKSATRRAEGGRCSSFCSS